MQAFELKKCLDFYLENQNQGHKTVMASLVGLDGSSYRKPGVRMLIAEQGSMCGALSGGCVEKEIVESAYAVFKTGQSKVISYDGRYRLGCEGFLYILIEPFQLTQEAEAILNKALEQRHAIEITSIYKEGTQTEGPFYSEFFIPTSIERIPAHPHKKLSKESYSIFRQVILPSHQLVIIGTEHDANKLCQQAALLGWDVIVIATPNHPKTLKDFPEAKEVRIETPESMDVDFLDSHSSVVLMTHNYALDLHYLLQLKDAEVPYMGVLGSKKRKLSLENDLFEKIPELSETFLERIHSPAGLNIGAVTPEEIALSIVAEILTISQAKRAVHYTSSNQKIVT